MTTFQRIKETAIEVAYCIHDYELAYRKDTDDVDFKRTKAARKIAELAQMISNAAKVTETITEQI